MVIASNRSQANSRVEEFSSMKVLLCCLFVLDVVAITACVILAVFTSIKPSHLPYSVQTLVNLSVLLGTYGITSLLCNSLAYYGVEKNIR